jgi:L-alanine-DL-glutamate epimerase-like enolase superfamily enzyme
VKITQIEIIPIRAPRKETVRSGAGVTPVNASEFGIVRIIAEDGTEGVGEISITFPRIGFSLCHAAQHVLAPLLIGREALRTPALLEIIDGALIGELSAPYLRAAFEMALLDLKGRYYGIPVYELLGGKIREAVPLAWGIYQKAPEEMAADAARAVQDGFRAIKLKVGRDLETDRQAVHSVAKAIGPNIPLRLDANMAWRTVPQAVHAIETLAAEVSIAWVEQPLGRDNLDGLRLLRARTHVPIMADESLQGLRDAYYIARANAADVFNVYIVEAGGLQAARDIFAFASTVGIPCILGSQAELGIGTAAAAHLAVSVSDLPYPIETFGPMRYPRDIVTSGWTIAHGRLSPLDKPGLGVELDWSTIDAWRADL